jgi:hypothetical protein
MSVVLFRDVLDFNKFDEKISHFLTSITAAGVSQGVPPTPLRQEGDSWTGIRLPDEPPAYTSASFCRPRVFSNEKQLLLKNDSLALKEPVGARRGGAFPLARPRGTPGKGPRRRAIASHAIHPPSAPTPSRRVVRPVGGSLDGMLGKWVVWVLAAPRKGGPKGSQLPPRPARLCCVKGDHSPPTTKGWNEMICLWQVSYGLYPGPPIDRIGLQPAASHAA